MSLRLYGRMKEGKNCSELLISLLKKESRMKEKTKMNTQDLSLSTIKFVAEVYKGSDMTLGEAVTLGEQYEEEQNAWIDMIESEEDLMR